MIRLLPLALVALALCAAGTPPSRAADDVTLILNWYLGGLHAPFYLGQERGFYADEDINLTIQEGRGSAVAAQVVAAGDVDFGMSDAGSLMLAGAKGLPIKAVMSLLNTSGFGVISLAETGIQSVKDLEGKTLAVSPGDALTQLFPAVVAANVSGAGPAYTVTVTGMLGTGFVVVGIPAGAGAIIGGIVGGGRGAAIGATIGGGAGTAVVLSTAGDEVELPGGTTLTLPLESAIDVRVPVARPTTTP